ncbi:hypothetical protein, partial [Streptomyces sp. NPDC002922]|uniref:hypothetical protein n=1 Tax=Streptomyces sp. NPDC002922 TaxID=3154439 RepID=UPI0033B2EB0A
AGPDPVGRRQRLGDPANGHVDRPQADHTDALTRVSPTVRTLPDHEVLTSHHVPALDEPEALGQSL